MYRWIAIPVVLIALLLVVGGGIWYFSYGMGGSWPEKVSLATLEAPATIRKGEGGVVSINAASERDAFTALGYAHGMERSWQIVLYRQAALGRLSEWFGEPTIKVDEVARRLGFAALAREAYEGMPEESRDLLEAFSLGVNAAFGSREVGLVDELALLDVEPERWEPWHVLALERLYAWLSTPQPRAQDVAAAGQDAAAFFQNEDLLRRLLHLHHLRHSLAWASRDTSGTFFYQRHVYGASALPFHMEAVLSWTGSEPIAGATLPGTPFFNAGKRGNFAWSILPGGSIRFEKVPLDESYKSILYERLIDREGEEHLLTIRRTHQAIYFEPPPPRRIPVRADTTAISVPDSLAGRSTTVDSILVPQDSTWIVEWNGFAPVTDWPSWYALLSASPVSFRLLEGSGLSVTQDGTWQIIGSPAVVAPLRDGVLVGSVPWTRYVARGLDTLRTNEVGSPQEWIDSDYSAWAAELAPSMIASVDSVPRHPDVIAEALTYLKNWDASYDRAAIAASIFDSWVNEYQASTDSLPQSSVPETVYFENVRRYQALGRAVARLRNRLGDDMSEWRWENAFPDRRLFPIWSADSLLDFHSEHLASTRFAPIERPAHGHPTAIQWGSSIVESPLPAPSLWESWIHTSAWDQPFARSDRFELSGFLSRYRLSEQLPSPRLIHDSGPSAVAETVLSPE